MSLTTEQLATRRKYITASDVSAVLGHNPHKTAWDVWAEKKLDTTPNPAGEAAEIGNDLENAMLDWGARKVGIDPESLKRQYWSVSPGGIVAATIDATATVHGVGSVTDLVGFEAKTTSIEADAWGDEGTDQVPIKVLFQVTAQMIAEPKIRRVYVPALLAGFRLERRLYVIERDAELCAMVEDQVTDWWNRYIVGNEQPPADVAPSLDILKRVVREPKKTVQIDAGLVEAWRNAEEAFKIAEARQEQAKGAVLAALGDAEVGECHLGRVTYGEQQGRTGIDAAELEAKWPDVFKQVQKPGKPFRVCRWKPAKEPANARA